MRARSDHGLTLVELLVALAATSIVMLAVIGAVRAQQEGFRGGQRVREAQSSARAALLFIEQKLASAGYGIDPVLAFDLTGQPGDPDATVFYRGPCPAEMAPCDKDRVDGSDELVFHARNPNYWTAPPSTPPPPPEDALRGRVWVGPPPSGAVLLNAAAGTLKIQARAGDFFPKGLILQGVCAEGAGAKYFTVDETVGPLATDLAVTLELAPEVLGDPFKRQSAGACDPARIFQVDRYRFHVRPVPNGDGTYEPFLVLDTGTDANGDGAVDAGDERIVAAGVETIQVSYLFQLHAEPPNPAIPPAGAEPGVVIRVQPGAPNVAVQGRRGTAATATDTPAPSAIVRPDFESPAAADPEYYDQASLYPYRFGPPLAAERKTNHQGNIHAVRVVLVGRSSTPTEGSTGLPPGVGGAVLNMNATAPWILNRVNARGGSDGYERVRLETTILVPSMVSRRLLFD